METILTSIGLGIAATASPCVLPLYPGFLAYISGGQEGLQGKSGRYLLGFFVLAGVLTMMLALGGLIALLSLSVGRALSFLSGSAQRWITHQFARHARLLNLFSGLLLVGVGVYDLISNWDLIGLFL